MARLPLLLAYLLLCLVYPLSQLPRASGQELEHASFGSTAVPPSLNWTWFWQVFNAHSAWDLEYNDGSGWVSRKSDLQIVKNYSRLVGSVDGGTMREYNMHAADADAVKIGLNFTASFTADYRLTFIIDLDVRNYSHREGSWNYTLSYQNHTVYFDWSDIQDLPLDAVNHGVMPVGDESYFWFRIRKNNVAAGTNVFIDPSFGEDGVGATLQNWSGPGYAYRNMAKYTPTAGDGTLDSITVYVDFSTEGSQNMSCAFYFAANTSRIDNASIGYVSGDGWYQFNFSDPKPTVKNNIQYGLAFWGEDGAPTVGYRYESGSGTVRYAADQTGWPTWPSTFTGSNATRLLSIYANYTLSAAGATYSVFPAVNLTFSLSMGRVFYGIYSQFPSVALDFALASTVQIFRTWTSAHTVNLAIGLASSLNHITAMWNVYSAVAVDLAVSSVTTPFITYVQYHALTVVFAVASTAEEITGALQLHPSIIVDLLLSATASPFLTYTQTSSVNLVFALASTAKEIAAVLQVSPTIVVNFALASAISIQRLFLLQPAVAITFALSSTAEFIQHFYTVASSVALEFVLNFFSPAVITQTIDVSTPTAGIAILAVAIALSAVAIELKKRRREDDDLDFLNVAGRV